MHWLLASLIAPLIWSIVNHVDKIIIARYFHGSGAGGLMIFVGVIALPFALLIMLYDASVVHMNSITALTLIGSGLFYNLAIYLYLKVLERSDASYVVPFWQLTPVCAYGFGILFLNEYIESQKLIGGAMVIVGALLLSVGHSGARYRVDTRSISLMTLSSATIALGYILFKDADTAPFLAGLFWNQVGMTIFGAVFFMITPFRREFLGALRQYGGVVFGLNVLEQALEIAGVVAANFAVLLAPAALVILVEYSSQPVFVFLLGIGLTLLFPRIVQEDISRRTLVKKTSAIALMTLGLILVV